jgi:hypothetical protein
VLQINYSMIKVYLGKSNDYWQLQLSFKINALKLIFMVMVIKFHFNGDSIEDLMELTILQSGTSY